MGKIHKERIWLAHKLSENAILAKSFVYCDFFACQAKKKKILWRIVTGDEKWIYFDNPKRKKSWMDPGKTFASTPKRNIHGHKSLLCIWWDQEGVLYYELLRPNETVIADRYQQQFRLSDELMRKRSSVANNRRKSFYCMITLDRMLQKA